MENIKGILKETTSQNSKDLKKKMETGCILPQAVIQSYNEFKN